MEIIKTEDFDKTIKEGVVFVDFFATWCGPCKMLVPVLEELQGKFKDIKFVKVDVDESEEIAERYSIMSIPTMYLFKDGNLVAKTSGYRGVRDLTDFINNNI